MSAPPSRPRSAVAFGLRASTAKPSMHGAQKHRWPALGLALGLATTLLSSVSGATDPPVEPADAKDEELEVTVRGDTSGAYVSRASVDRSSRAPIDAASLLAE